MVEKIKSEARTVTTLERRQSCVVFVDEVKQVGFKARFKCGEGR